MEYLRTLIALTMLAATSALLVLTISTANSFAQNETASLGNQSIGMLNDTAMANETESGNISAINTRIA